MYSELSVFADDRTRIALTHYRRGSPELIIISHGFFNSRNSRSLQRIVRFLLPYYDVITFDYRGHGQSAGTYTFGAREIKDLTAVVRYSGGFPYRKKALMGFSLGAAVAVQAAQTADFDSFMLISCPSSFYSIDCHFWEKAVLTSIRDLFGENGRNRKARIGNPFLSKPQPCAGIRRISSPILFIHGQRDWLIKPWHSRQLHSLSRAARLEILRGGLHAEKLTEQFPDLFRRLALDWLRETLA
ncbi:MAG: alpha/beta fold hydrolase [Deltaproteobacteria bacterium]